MNILLVSQYLVGGGLERMVHLLASELVRLHGCSVTLLAFDSIDSPEIRKRLNDAGVTCIFAPKKPGFSWDTVKLIMRIVKEKNIDVVHTHESAPLIYSSIAKVLSFFKFKLIHTQHSFIHLQKHPGIARYDRNFSHFANAITAVSKQVQEEYLKIGVPQSKVITVLNGVEFPSSTLDQNEKLALRNKLILSNQQRPEVANALNNYIKDTWLISLARVHPKKGQDRLIRLWAALPTHIQSKITLLFVGPETETGELKRLNEILSTVPNHERILFIGASTDPVQWLQASDIFLSGSEYEGMPLAPIESAGAGLPLILSDIQGHQLLSHYAHLFPYDSPDEGAKTLIDILNKMQNEADKIQAILQEQATSVRSKFGSERMARHYFKLYRKACRRTSLARFLRQIKLKLS